MPTRNEFAAQRQARSNAKAAYSLDKELYSKMIDDSYNNALKDIGKFRATILSVRERFMVSEEAGQKKILKVDGNAPANFYEVIVRPEWCSQIPAPWEFEDFRLATGGAMQGNQCQAAIKAHPIARSVSPANNGNTGEALAVGDIVICTFGIGPNNSGKYRDIRFEINSVGRDEDLIKAAGGLRIFDSFVRKIAGVLGSVKQTLSGMGSAMMKGFSCRDLGQSLNRFYAGKGSTISVEGNLCHPETLKWTGRHRSGGSVKVYTDVGPVSRTYVGIEASMQGQKVYNGLFVDSLFMDFPIQRVKYTTDANTKERTFQKSAFFPTSTFKVLKDAYQDLYDMNEAYKAEFGHDIPIVSLERSYERQVIVKSNHHTKKQTKAQKAANQPGSESLEKIADGSMVNTGGLGAAKPGSSKHGWGLAIDVSVKAVYQKNGKSHYDSSTARWLREHGWKYQWINNYALRPGGDKGYLDEYGNEKRPYGRKWSEAWHFEWRPQNTALQGQKNPVSWYEDEIPAEYK